MKKFLSNIASSALGTLIAISIVMACLFFFAVSASISMGSASAPSITSNSVLRIDLKGVMSERASTNPLVSLGINEYVPSVEDITRAIEVAKNNKNICGIYIKCNALSASPASLQEIRRALVDFRKSGKFVVSYGGIYTQSAYYVCSAANKVLLNPAGQVEWRGLGGEAMYYKDLLDKLGIQMQVFKVGTYKSFVEPYTSTHMSDSDKVQVTRYVTGIWSTFKKDVSESRKVSVDSLDRMADEYLALKSAKDVMAAKMVDSLAYEDDALGLVARLAGKKKAKDVKFLSVDAIAPIAESNTSGGEVAVYYATGEIVGSEEAGSLMGSEAIVADKIIPDLDELADDDDVKAVVLRINSGGGSAYASEQIWHAVKKLAARKPVVVSMGDVAASGAYYMSCGAQYIVAEPTTLTGSIGIFGIIPDVSGLMKDKLGIKFDGVKTNAHSDFFAMSRPMSGDEKAMMQSYVDNGYVLFKSRVAQGRKLSMNQVESVAQGRVWTGEDALRNRLVDKLGNLDDAIAVAADKAGLKKYHSVHYPEQQAWWEAFVTSPASSIVDDQVRSYLGTLYPAVSLMKHIDKLDRVQARIPYNPIVR